MKTIAKYDKMNRSNDGEGCAVGEPQVRCLMVETGEEKKVMQLLHVRRLGRGLFPQRVRIRKIRGVWRRDRLRLLPGYVFVYTDEEEIPIWKYQGMEHVLKVLRYDREPNGYLRGYDLDFANAICELDGKLDILEAVNEEGFIRITDKLLKQLHGEVISVDKGKRLVKIRFNLMGQTKIIQMNYQLLGDDGEPLDPVEELLDDESDEWFTAWTPDFADDLAEELDREAETAEADGKADDNPEPDLSGTLPEDASGDWPGAETVQEADSSGSLQDGISENAAAAPENGETSQAEEESAEGEKEK